MTDIDITQLRASIDKVDDQIVALLRERCNYVRQVGMTKKARQQAGKSFIRSGREATMVRNIFQRFSENSFPPKAAAHLWRIIIAASLSLESGLTVSAYFSEQAQEVFWLAREYFGNFTPIGKQTSSRRVIADVMDEKAEVGALPLPGFTPEGSWWQKLPEDVKIFACVPFILAADAMPEALLIARVEPEATGDDITLISIETRKDVSQSRMNAVFEKHKLPVHWVGSEHFTSGHRIHLIELRGFYTASDAVMTELNREIGQEALVALRHLGSYAVAIRT